MSKRKRGARKVPPGKKITQILLDEQFLMCASGQGCDSKPHICQHEAVDDRELYAIEALLAAYRAKIALIIDQPEVGQYSRVRNFYNNYLENCRKKGRGQLPVAAKVLANWLNGRGGRITRMKPASIDSKALKECNLKPNTLDPLICQLAIACRGAAPIWTLDSDFWCASQFHPEIKPTCPKDALDSLK